MNGVLVLLQGLSTAQAHERYRIPTRSNTTKIYQLLRENLRLLGPQTMLLFSTAVANTVPHLTPSSQPQKSRSKSKGRSKTAPTKAGTSLVAIST